MSHGQGGNAQGPFLEDGGRKDLQHHGESNPFQDHPVLSSLPPPQG